ncbi:MAG: molybdenum cofactor biosynthesis protein MoaE [Pseudomonadota bacterium]
MTIRLVDLSFDPGAELSAFSTRAVGAGGVVSFSGHVRPQSTDGTVQSLMLQIHPVLTLAGMQTAEREAIARWSLIDSEIIHRHGDIGASEAIVFVATASAHRRAAFEAADFLMDYLKTKAVFWKKEAGPGGERWIEPREDDYADAERWI